MPMMPILIQKPTLSSTCPSVSLCHCVSVSIFVCLCVVRLCLFRMCIFPCMCCLVVPARSWWSLLVCALVCNTTQACAHRYINNNAGMGGCYVFGQTLSGDDFDLHQPCDSQPHNNFMKDFGLCQAGMSVAIGQVRP